MSSPPESGSADLRCRLWSSSLLRGASTSSPVAPGGAWLPTADDFAAAAQSRYNSFRDLYSQCQNEYVRQLRSANLCNRKPRRPIQLGDICIVKEESPPRSKRPLVRILALHRKRASRVCKHAVRFSNGNEYHRATQVL